MGEVFVLACLARQLLFPTNGGHEGYEEDLLAPLQAARLRRKGSQVHRRPHQGQTCQEQGRQDRVQGDVSQRQEEPMDRRLLGGQEGAQYQGLRRRQEGLTPLHQGQSSLQEVSVSLCVQQSKCVYRRAVVTANRGLGRRGRARSLDGLLSPSFQGGSPTEV